MLEKRKFRMSNRTQRRENAGAGRAMTDEDIQNMDSFAAKLDEAIELLNTEINAIEKGQLGVVTEVFEQKSAVLRWLELRMPLVEPFLGQEAATERQLPARLAELKEVVIANSAFLSRMSDAVGAILREINKATDRHSLNGLYGKNGRKIGAPGNGRVTIDSKV